MKFIYTVFVNGHSRYHGINAADALDIIIAVQGSVFTDKIEVQRTPQNATTDDQLLRELISTDEA